MLERFLYPDYSLERQRKRMSLLPMMSFQRCPQASYIFIDDYKATILKKADRISLKYCRAISATYLRKQAVQSEVIHIHQGRVPKSISTAQSLKINSKISNTIDPDCFLPSKAFIIYITEASLENRRYLGREGHLPCANNKN